MSRRPARLGRWALGAVCAALPAMAQQTGETPPRLAASVEVVARSVAIDVLDAKGRPVDVVPPGSLRVLEDGVERLVLAVERSAAPAPAGAIAAAGPASAVSAPGAPPVAETRVVVALDPLTLGPREWREATAELAGVAESLVALGPVDVVALTAPVRVLVSGARGPEAVRTALADAAASVSPLDAFYRGRLALLRDAQERRGAFESARSPARSQGGSAAEQAAAAAAAALMAQSIERVAISNAARELAAAEQRIVDEAIGRLTGAAAGVRRPAVLVWVAGGDLLPGEFVRQLLPDGFDAGDLQEIVSAGQQSAWWSALDEVWKRWAQEGLRVVAWSPSRTDNPDIGAADVRRPVENAQRIKLAIDPLALFESASSATNGALVQHAGQLTEALASVRGRFVVSYQTDAVAPGWHDLRIEVAAKGLAPRYPPRILVPELPALPAAPPVTLAVELVPVRSSSPQPGRESVRLPVVVDLDPIRDMLPADAEARFVVRILATPPNGHTVAREVEVRLPRLPAEGWLRYETTLTVPIGTSAYAVEVREATTGAMGSAGPLDAVDADAVDTSVAEGASTAAAAGATASAAFAETSEVRIGEARFLMPADAVADERGVRVLWDGAEQKVVRLAGGPGSPLELGVAIDVSESVTAERSAFARAASAAAARLVGREDRVFRVDFGATPRFMGAMKGGAGELFAVVPAGKPEGTAIFDGVKFALQRFEGSSDRMALVVLTDGCETTGRTAWQEVARAARSRAVPVFFVVADGSLCTKSIRYRDKGVLEEAGVVSPGWVVGSTDDMKIAHGSRWALGEIAKTTGGMVFSLARADGAGKAWDDVEAALDRLWVALFEPSSPTLDSRHVEVRLGRDRLLRSSD
jgi:hypothetical protein